MTDVVVVGSVNYDLGLRVQRLPWAGETVLSSSLTRRSGGKGANQAVAVREAGVPCAMVGVVGADGAALVAQLVAAGVDVTRIRADPDATTGTAVIMIDDDGQNSIIVSSGANDALTAAEVREAIVESGARTVLTQGESPVEAITAAAEAAESASLRFVLNLAPAIDVPRHVIAVADPLVVNELEAEETALALGVGSDRLSGPDLAETLAEVARSVVITLGAGGAVWAARGEGGRAHAQRVEVVDTTGAGDAFVGAMVARLTRGDDLAAAVGSGVSAGTRTVQFAGARAAEAR
ncbi:ribokinase [Microbacterium kyungheense]|uniref:Ribokinase n=1 Tax=Microbacterium kyungheense TaxID=1263636 RepID=A0A543EQH0_9MICO|nr:ribokinase [Microbacterium kyungheense]TQM23820.1 ribokinase [Microbacterium kyungheense]